VSADNIDIVDLIAAEIEILTGTDCGTVSRGSLAFRLIDP